MVVHRRIICNGARRYVDHDVVVPADLEPAGIGHLADNRREDLPLLAHREESVDLARLDDRAHAFLLSTSTSCGSIDGSRSGTRSRATRMPPVPADASSVVAHARPAPPRSWMPTTRSAPKISRQHSIRTFSANGSPTRTDGRLACDVASKVALGEHGDAADAVASGARAEQDDRVAGTVSPRELNVVVVHNADAQRVDERITEIAVVEHDLAAHVGQTEVLRSRRHRQPHPAAPDASMLSSPEPAASP